METLLTFINGMQPKQQEEFAERCKTSVGYIRKAISAGQKFGDGLCINIERESFGAVRCEDLRPDVDWAYLRGTKKKAA